MEFKDCQAKLPVIFNHEYIGYHYVSIKGWAEFINNKDLGISFDEEKSGRWFKEYVYKILDTKKWTFSRLKYGI